MNAKTVAMAVGAYLILIGGMMYLSENSTDATPTADSIAKLPSLGSAMINIGVGLAAVVFAPKLARAV